MSRATIRLYCFLSADYSPFLLVSASATPLGKADLMLLSRVGELIGDAALVVPIVFALPLAILVVGTPIVLFVRLLIAMGEWI
jgi:hypothetical protein